MQKTEICDQDLSPGDMEDRCEDPWEPLAPLDMAVSYNTLVGGGHLPGEGNVTHVRNVWEMLLINSLIIDLIGHFLINDFFIVAL